MVSQGVSLATKGIIGNCSLPVKGVLILCIVETTIKKRGGWVQGEKKRKIVSVYYNYENELYEYRQVVDEDVNITLADINIDIIDSKPIINFKITE